MHHSSHRHLTFCWCIWILAHLGRLVPTLAAHPRSSYVSDCSPSSSSEDEPCRLDSEGDSGSNSLIRVAHIGNSMQYYGDTPRMLQQMLETRFATVLQNSMLRRAGTFKSMFRDGRNMQDRYNETVATLPDGTLDLGAPNVTALFQDEWDVVVMNDRSTHPARDETRQDSLMWLEESYIPVFPPTAQAIFLATAPDRIEDNREATVGLGPFEEFSSRTRSGVQEYANLFREEPYSIPARVAPIGDAFGLVRDTLGEEAFVQLYSPSDNFHHSPHGTWLQCCILYCMIVDEEPPVYNPTWWQVARYLESRDKQPSPDIPFPTEKEAEDLRKLAMDVCDKLV
mmetsp:Transcript_28787/g.47944  ORF Transcript_28787/g.47944 Transcript_28787/m.47944 type:complete len:340 (-) Transcript_28787:99-1118(-)